MKASVTFGVCLLTFGCSLQTTVDFSSPDDLDAIDSARDTSSAEAVSLADTRSADSGSMDGRLGSDTGSTDVGPAGDSGSDDAGSPDTGLPDVGPADTGAADAEPSSCDDLFSEDVPGYTLCLDRDDSCTFYSYSNFTLNCHEMCALGGKNCIGALQETAANTCLTRGNGVCGERYRDIICVCLR